MDFSTKEPNRRVLALDDEVDVLEFLRLLLESLGWEVTTASTPEEAFERLSGEAHFLIMTDIAMPRMDGYEFMSAVQSRGIPSRMAFMTGFGYDPNHTLVKIRRDHHYPVLFKPFSREKVSQAVQSAYDSYHAELAQG